VSDSKMVKGMEASWRRAPKVRPTGPAPMIAMAGDRDGEAILIMLMVFQGYEYMKMRSGQGSCSRPMKGYNEQQSDMKKCENPCSLGDRHEASSS